MRFIVYVDGRGGLINPTLSEYVIAREVYVTDEQAEEFRRRQQRDRTGRGQLRRSLRDAPRPVHRQDLDLRRARAVPEGKVVAHVDSSGDQIVAKVFLTPDFITYVEEGMGEPGAFKRQQPAGYVAPAFSLGRPRPAPALDPAFEAHAAPLRGSMRAG